MEETQFKIGVCVEKEPVDGVKLVIFHYTANTLMYLRVCEVKKDFSEEKDLPELRERIIPLFTEELKKMIQEDSECRATN